MTAAGKRKRVGPVTLWAVGLAARLVRLLARTWRYTTVNAEALEGLRAQGIPIVFTVWHGRMLPLAWYHRDQGITILVSPHADGDVGVRIAQSFGFRTERGSTYRDAGRALLRMSRAAAEGREVVFTPDGPRGPAETVSPGALIVAQRSGAPIVPVTAGARHAWRLRSWDRFLIPKPFARVTVVYGDAVYVDEPTARDAAAEAQRLEQVMRELTAAADA